MSEEKKLADEEIVKALERCREGIDEKCEKCLFRVNNQCTYDQIYGTDIVLDLIHRLQRDNAELKKQVDELLQEKGYLIERRNAGEKKAVKDTAKEILTDAKKWVKEHYKDKVTDSFGERPMLFMEAFGCLLAYLKDKHGVEVE